MSRNVTFTPREMEVLALAWQCMETQPKIDMHKLASLTGYTPGSASVTFGKIKQKIKLVGESISGTNTSTSKSKSSSSSSCPGKTGATAAAARAKTAMSTTSTTPRKRSALAPSTPPSSKRGKRGTNGTHVTGLLGDAGEDDDDEVFGGMVRVKNEPEPEPEPEAEKESGAMVLFKQEPDLEFEEYGFCALDRGRSGRGRSAGGRSAATGGGAGFLDGIEKFA